MGCQDYGISRARLWGSCKMFQGKDKVSFRFEISFRVKIKIRVRFQYRAPVSAVPFSVRIISLV